MSKASTTLTIVPAANADALGLQGYLIKRLLNHRNKSNVTDGYIVTDLERLREPMQRITDRLLSNANQKTNRNIVYLTN